MGKGSTTSSVPSNYAASSSDLNWLRDNFPASAGYKAYYATGPKKFYVVKDSTGGSGGSKSQNTQQPQPQPQPQPPPQVQPMPTVDPQVEALKSQLQSMQNMFSQMSNAYSSALPTGSVQPQALQAAQPATIQQQPTLQDITPPQDVQAAQPAQQPTEEAPKNTGGFVINSTPLESMPSVDKLFNLYKQVFGQGDQQVQAYLGGPQFQGMLHGGRVPLWMASDPMWRSYFQKLGLWGAISPEDVLNKLSGQSGG